MADSRPLLLLGSRPFEERMEIAKKGPTWIIDGKCNLCNGYVRWVHNRLADDSDMKFMWAQHDDTQVLLKELGIDDIMRQMCYLEDGQTLRSSSAALRACAQLRTPWRWLSKLEWIPRIVRDNVYNIIATNRYLLLGKSDVCQRPPQDLKNRYLHSLAVNQNALNEDEIYAEGSSIKSILILLSIGVGCFGAGYIALYGLRKI